MENTESKRNPYELEGLTEEFKSERDKLSRVTGHLSIIGDRIQEEMNAARKEFQKEQARLEGKLGEKLEASAKTFAQQSFEIFQKQALSKTQEAMSKLENLANKTYLRLDDLSSASKISVRKLLILMSVGGLLSGITGGLVLGFFFNDLIQMSQKTKQQLAWGIALEKGYGELSERERASINKLLRDFSPH